MAEITKQKDTWNKNKDIIERYWDEYERGDELSQEFRDNLSKENAYVKDQVAILTSGQKTWKQLNDEKEEQFKEPSKPSDLKSSLKGLASSALTSVGNMAFNAGLSIIAEKGVELAIKGIDYLVNYDNNIIAKGEEAKDSILNQTQAYESQKQTLTELSGTYSKLVKGVDISGNTIKNVRLSNDEFKSFLDTSNQLANIAPSMVKTYDSEGNAILNLGQNASEINKTVEDYIKLQRDLTHISTRDSLQDQYKGTIKSAEKIQEELDSYNLDLARSQDSLDLLEDFKEKIVSPDFVGPLQPYGSFVTIDSSAEKDVRAILKEFDIFPEMQEGDDNKLSFLLNSGSMSPQGREKLSKYIDQSIQTSQEEVALIQSQAQAQKLLYDSKWKELIPSLQSYVDSSNMFDSLSSVEADRVKSGLKTMISNIDYSTISDAVNKAGSIDNWIDQQLIAPMMSGSKQVKEAWSGLFELEDSREEMSISEFAEKRNEYLKTIAKSQNVSFEEMAARLGYATRNDDGTYTWTTKDEIDRAVAKTGLGRYGQGSLGNYLNGLDKETYDIAIDIILNGEENISSIQQLDKLLSKSQETAKLEELSLSNMQSNVTAAQSALSSFSTVLTETTSAGGVSADNIALLTAQFNDLEDVDLSTLFINTTDGVKLNIDALKQLSKQQNEIKANEFAESIELQQKAIDEYKNSANEASKQTEEYKTTLESMENNLLGTQQAQSQFQAIRKQQDELFIKYPVQMAKTALSTISTVLSETVAAGGVSSENISALETSFSDLENVDLSSLFLNTTDGVKLNIDSLKQLSKQQTEIESSKFAKAIEEQNEAIKKQEEIVQDATKSEKERQLAQQEANRLTEELSDIKQAQSQWQAIQKQQQELFSDYSTWQRATQTENAGNKYLNLVSGLKATKEAWDAGLVGTDDFKSFAALISPTGSDDAVNFAENYTKAKKYLTEDISGVKNFLNDLDAKGLADFNEETQEWSYNIKDMATAAKQMSMGEEFMSAMFGRLEDYGFHNNFISSVDEGIDKVTQLSTALGKEEVRLKELQKTDPDNTTAIEASKDKIEGYKRDIEEVTGYMSTVSEQAITDAQANYDAAVAGIKALNEQRQSILKSDMNASEKESVYNQLTDQMESMAKSAGTTVSTVLKLDDKEYLGQLEKDKERVAALKEASPDNVIKPDFGEDTVAAENYESALSKIQTAYENNDSALQNSVETLSQYTSEQLKSIRLNDGAYDSPKLTVAEQALDSICDSLGLSTDEATQLVSVLESMGLVKPEIEVPDIDSLQALQEAEKISPDIELDFNSAEMSTDELQAKLEELNGLKAEIDAEVNPEASAELDELISKTQQEYDFRIAFESTGMTPEEFLNKSHDEQIEIMAEVGVDESNYDAFISSVEGQTITTKIQTELTNGTTVDELLGMDDQQLAATLKIDTSQVEEAKAQLQELQDTTAEASVTVKIDNTQFDQLTSAKNNQDITITATVNGQENVDALKAAIDSIESKDVSINATVTGVTETEALKTAVDTIQNKEASVTALSNGISELQELKAAIDAIYSRTVKDGADVFGTDDLYELKAAIDALYDRTVSVGASVFGTGEVYGLLSAINSLHDKVVNVVTNYTSTGSPGGSQSSGTMLSPARSSGTAYNVLNTIPLTDAHASGKVALSKDEYAVVNELEQESLIRDGVWQLIPGKMHMEHLKKGDIILNGKQTSDLIKHGKTDSHARAYASGTLSNAYSSGKGWGAFQGGAAKSNKTSSSSSLNETAKNVEKASSSLQSAAKSTEKAAESTKVSGEALENAVKKFVDNAKDWIEISIDRIERTIQKYKDIAESRGTLTSTKKYLNLAIKETNKEIKTQQKAKTRYTKQANDVAAAVGLSDSLKKKVQNGTIDISTLSEDDKKRVDAYQQWYEKILDCDDAIRQLNKDVEALAKQKVDSIVEIFDSHIGKKDAKQQYYESIQNWRETAGYSENVGSEYYDAIKKQLSLEKQKQPLIEDEIRQYKAQMKAYAKNKGTNKFNATTYREMEATLMELEASYYDNKTAIAEFEQALYDTKEQVKQWRVDTAVRAGAKQDAVINYKDVADNYTLSEKDYTERIKTVSEQIERLSALRAEKYAEMLKYGINSPKYQELASEIADIDEEVINLGSDIEEFKNKIMEIRWKPFYEAQEALSNVISEYEDLRNLLGDDESFFHDDGSFSTNGLTNILLLQESVDASKQKIANYRKQLENLEEQYKNGCFSVEEYKEKTQELIDGIRDSAQAVAAYEQQMLDMYETQITMENDLLQKNIDKRLEALKAKEDYYNYDKTLKKKSKDINALKAQIAALEGTSNAAAAARLERLKAELAEAEEDMEDTVHQHQTEMKEAGFEEFQDNANAALENTTNALRTNTEFQKSVIQSMLDTVTAGYDSTYSHLNSLIEQHGIVVSETYEKMLTSVANFNTGAANLTLPDASVSGSDNSPVYTGSQSSKDTVDSTVKDNETSAGAMEEHEAKKLTIDKTSMTLYIGDTGTITATVTPKDIPVTWTSSSTSVATVSKGKVKAKKKGSTTIEAKAGSLTKKCKVTVKDISDELVEQIGQGSTSSTGTTSSSKPTTNTSGGDGKAKVGDTCTFNSGKYYAASDGSGASGTQYLGKKVKITKINSASWATHPYLIKSADGKTDLGWVKLSQLKGYAKGGVVGKKGYMPVDMNSVLGKAVISNGDSGLIGINPGETVLTEKFTELLKPSVAAMENFTRVYPQLSNPNVASSEQNLSFYNETHIHVDQAVTKEDIKAMGNYITDIVTKNFVRDMKKYR